ncbi:MAG: EAL domain-containing protein [Methylophilaceae bacterium]
MTIKKSIKDPSNGGVSSSEVVGLLEDFKPLLSPMFDCSEDAVVVVGCDDEVVYVNHQFLQQAELTVGQVLGNNFADICAGTVAMRCYSNVMQQVINSKKATTVSRVLDAAKSIAELVTISPILNKQQVVQGALLIGKQASIEGPLASEGAQEARQREVYQKVIMDNLSFIIWLKDEEGKFIFVNNILAEALGVSDPKNVIGKTDFDFSPKDVAAGYAEDDLKVYNSGESVTVVEQIQKSKGEFYWAETYKAPAVVNGEVIGTVGYARDVTEQKELISAISKKEFEYSSLIKNLPLSIVKYDTNCRRLFVNATAHDFAVESNMQSMVGKTPMEYWNSNIKNITAEAFQHKLMTVLQHGEKMTFEVHVETEGATYVNMVNLLPEFDENNQVVGALALANDVTEISKYRHDLEYLAFHDALTALPNRTMLNQQLTLAATEGNHFGLMLMDLDFFKTINDTLGHHVGDELLLEVAKRISASVRDDDLVARIGGDEFAILVTNLKNDADLAGLATQIAKKLSKPFNIENINFFVTASIGIACYPTDSEEVEDLIKFADTAMYDAKKRGRNNYQFYTPDLTEGVMEHLAIATALRYAIKKDELLLQYQPKVEIGTGKILGAETLLRWHGKVLGQIQPDKFIPIAEESGLIVNIGAWVLRASCEAAVTLNQHRENPLNIAINVSSKEFVGNNYIENLQYCLAETGCKPEWLTLEITESLLLHDGGKELETLIKIDEMGITLSIDDFGTGYSALAYLSKFPIRQVKIDRSFVMDICSTQSAAQLVKAIIAMTLSLNKELVAEGIETVEQANLIKEYGCNQAQGYLYSKPVSLSEFLHLVEQQNIH